MATAIAVILGVIALMCFAFWQIERSERARLDRDATESRAREEAAEARAQEAGRQAQAAKRDAQVLAQRLAKKEQELTDARVLHDAQRAERKSIMADMQQLYGARVSTEAQVQQTARLLPLMEQTAETVAELTIFAAQREANLRNDVEAERVLAAKSLDSLTQMGTHLVTLSTEMAGLQRIGFRPPVKEADQPKDSAVVGMPSVEDVDRELMEDHPEMAARYD
jgi:hypothetical protein